MIQSQGRLIFPSTFRASFFLSTSASVPLNITPPHLPKVWIINPFKQHRKRPLADHLADFESDLRAKGDTAKQVRLKIGRIRKVLTGCGFLFMADLSASCVQQHLTDLRNNRQPPSAVNDGKETCKRAEVAAALGIKPETVNSLVRRHRLEAMGDGKARRFPRATVLALRERLSRGRGVQTANDYLREIKSFCRWLVKDRRMADNPLAHLEGGNAKLDRRHDRRTLPAEELTRLFRATGESDQMFRGLSGQDRKMLYLTACGTGLRAGELASLLPEWFSLDQQPPTEILAARDDKSRKPVTQPLPQDVAELLREFLADKPAGQPVWPGTWVERAAEMLKTDLAEASIPYKVQGADGPQFADFHALRHSSIALPDQSEVSLKQAMQLARHSDPKLTMAR